MIENKFYISFLLHLPTKYWGFAVFLDKILLED